MYSLGRLLNVAQTGRSKGMEGMQRAILSMAPENILIFRIDVNQIIPNIGMRVSRVLQDSRGTNMAVERNAVGMLLIVAQTGICSTVSIGRHVAMQLECTDVEPLHFGHNGLAVF